jgi:hypothetical protein
MSGASRHPDWTDRPAARAPLARRRDGLLGARGTTCRQRRAPARLEGQGQRGQGLPVGGVRRLRQRLAGSTLRGEHRVTDEPAAEVVASMRDVGGRPDHARRAAEVAARSRPAAVDACGTPGPRRGPGVRGQAPGSASRAVCRYHTPVQWPSKGRHPRFPHQRAHPRAASLRTSVRRTSS